MNHVITHGFSNLHLLRQNISFCRYCIKSTLPRGIPISAYVCRYVRKIDHWDKMKGNPPTLSVLRTAQGKASRRRLERKTIKN